MSFTDRIRACNQHNLASFIPFIAAGKTVGWIRRDRVQILTDISDALHLSEDMIHLDPDFSSFSNRSDVMAGIVNQLVDQSHIPALRDEAFPVAEKFSDPPIFQIDRAAIPFFGVRAYGVHLNGYVSSPTGLKLWIGRRAGGKSTFPNMLDNMVAGGQPIGLTLQDNLIKECAEEADIPEAMARQAIAVGAVTYIAESEAGLKPDTLFCYDLALRQDFTPRNTDGEIASFHLMSVEDVAALVRDTEEFKPNCNLVIIDFLIRHGVIPPDDPDYLTLIKGLRQ
jgi:isopentenyldiphosphate isomerase